MKRGNESEPKGSSVDRSPSWWKRVMAGQSRTEAPSWRTDSIKTNVSEVTTPKRRLIPQA